MCISPLTLKKDIPDYLKNSQVKHVYHKVPCGKCAQCLSRRQRGWSLRLSEEAKVSDSVYFITLTYEDRWLPRTINGLPSLYKRDFQNFMKRLRRETGQYRKTDSEGNVIQKGIKYYACGEYGTNTERPHYHAILFNMKQLNSSVSDQILTAWGRGNVDVAPGNGATINYVTKYIMKGNLSKKLYAHNGEKYVLDDRQKEFSLMSKKLGESFLTPQMIKHLKEQMTGSVMIHGYHHLLPRYWKNRIFNKEERKQLMELANQHRAEQEEKLQSDTYKQEVIRKQKWNHVNQRHTL